MALPLAKIEEIHRDLWLASQLASSAARTVTSGHAMLDAELPGQGWPTGSLSEILVPQPGCGEVRLLKPALAATSARAVMLLQPPHTLQPTALSWWGLDPGNIRVLTPKSAADALWAAERRTIIYIRQFNRRWFPSRPPKSFISRNLRHR